mgnify:CR=1 FL=1
MKRTALQRRTPLRKRNPERRAKLHARNFGERGDAIRAMPCLACEVERSLASGCSGSTRRCAVGSKLPTSWREAWAG